LLADLKINLDRIDGRNGRKHAAARLPDQIADLRQRDSGKTVNWRLDFGEAEIQLRVFNGGFVRLDLCIRPRFA
jgi:hypothetical protein